MAQVFITTLLIAHWRKDEDFPQNMHIPNEISLPKKNRVKKMKDLPGQARQEEVRLMNDNEADLIRHLKKVLNRSQ